MSIFLLTFVCIKRLKPDAMKAQHQFERNRMRKEAVSKYFFDMSKLVFAALVLGMLTSLLTGELTDRLCYLFVVGCIVTYTFAIAGYKTIK